MTALPSGIAVDFGGTKIAAARVENGAVTAAEKQPTDGQAPAQEQIEAVFSLLERLAFRPGETVGVAVTGRVDAEGAWRAVNKNTLADVAAVPLKEILTRRLGQDVRVMNDALAAAAGEHAFGAGQGTRDFAYITVSTGVGGGLIVNGRPVESVSGLAGHIGFMTSREARARCGSGRMGTAESIASGAAIAAEAARAGHAGHNAESVFEAHRAGEAWAGDIIRRSAKAAAELAGNLKAAFDPERIAMGGGVGLAPGYIGLVNAAMAEEPPLFRAEIVPAQLGHNAPLIGVLGAPVPAR